MGNRNLPDNVTDRDIEDAWGGHEYCGLYDVEILYGKTWDLLGQVDNKEDLRYIHRWLTMNGNQVRVKDEDGKRVEI